MSLAITLRKHIHPNLFREIILHVVEKSLGDEIILCSGFFQENKKTKKGLDLYKISDDGKFGDYLNQNNISVTSIGVHYGVWKNEYVRFISMVGRTLSVPWMRVITIHLASATHKVNFIPLGPDPDRIYKM